MRHANSFISNMGNGVTTAATVICDSISYQPNNPLIPNSWGTANIFLHLSKVQLHSSIYLPIVASPTICHK